MPSLPISINSTLKCLERCRSLSQLKQLHAQILLHGLHQENYVAVKLISFCTKKLGSLDYSRVIFSTLKDSANVFLYTTMITSYSNHQSHLSKEAILIYEMMHRDGPHPNNFTLSSVLKACSFMKAMYEGTQVHAHSTKLGFDSSLYVAASLLDMYAKFGWILEARLLFDSVRERNAVVYNTMIACYAKVGDIETARQVFDKMPEKDSISWNIVISGYASNGNTSIARELFDEMLERNINSWNAMIAGYSRIGEWREAVDLFKSMLLGTVKPNHATMAVLMSACGHLGSLKLARQIHGFLQKNRTEMNFHVYNSLIDMYAKCGNVDEAYQVFDGMPMKDVVSYNVMISGLANHGRGQDALNLFAKIIGKGLRPDTFTFLGILSACNHAGLVDVGRDYFDCMVKVYAIKPSADHFACMVDLYGRAGLIEDALEFVKTMSVEPHAGVWGALLNACRSFCNIIVGELAAKEILTIEPGNPGNYVLLSNIYAKNDLWDAVQNVRQLMRGKGVGKTMGCSWIEVESEFHEFLMGGASHPKLEDISTLLRHLSLQLL
ncbi:pentatricopeptide repeat-containing protein At3g29230-like isoform X1 [Ananas comosus]|uniref:Pentatricopeptide repeat-containing protein At3g29230-like isoform X1 n=1 Tax=Ananas comosus TaxID=4615 RepID=A0A6P5FYI6_ANACO|nr:pentatricopeptide repeat-containing protein At3g29230-like isoform X1 [Ananas comosus]XP_020101093.1 pentatricopeptide repeat-containing protein At3g29230-like isoform X1 [Ananas comosus]XP_020101094.1 pentatricopeptide repeat-containing protein At3g29230-like isoform X1 [Ananas comosus]